MFDRIFWSPDHVLKNILVALSEVKGNACFNSFVGKANYCTTRVVQNKCFRVAGKSCL